MTGPLLRCCLDEPLPSRIVIGMGNMLILRGWAYCSDFPAASLSIVVDGAAYPVERYGTARADVVMEEFPRSDPHGYSLFSGFWALIPLKAASGTVPVDLVLTSADGREATSRLGSIELTTSTDEPIQAKWPGRGAKVAICMATYNPPLDLFRQQIASLVAQTHGNWICVITDDRSPDDVFAKMQAIVAGDPRFVIFGNADRLNFYHNFERAMTLAPADADYIALCDQDDRWDSDKLETLLGAFQADTQLVYSDCRLTDAEGKVYAETFWHNRRNNYRNLQALLVANTVTGAASLFRAALLKKILPLPTRVGDAYHDHWIALTAIVNGKIGYIDRPLYDYIQHGGNVIGHNYSAGYPGFLRYGFELLRRAYSPRKTIEAAKIILNQGVVSYIYVMRTVLLARLLLIRNKPSGGKARILRKFARFGDSLRAPLTERMWAAVQRRPTLNLEGFLLFSAFATRAVSRYHRLRRRKFDPPTTPMQPHPDDEPLNSTNFLRRQSLFFAHPLD